MSMAADLGQGITVLCRALVRSAGEFAPSAAIVGGVSLFVYGSWLIYRPAGFLIAGISMATGSILYERGQRP
jgi:hypothetical protein